MGRRRAGQRGDHRAGDAPLPLNVILNLKFGGVHWWRKVTSFRFWSHTLSESAHDLEVSSSPSHIPPPSVDPDVEDQRDSSQEIDGTSDSSTVNRSSTEAGALRRLHTRVVPEVSEAIRHPEIENIWKLRRKGTNCPGKDQDDSWELLTLAEEFWSGELKDATERLDRHKAELASINNELFQLVGFYSVLQGVLLTVAAQANLLRCAHVWVPITLSLLATCYTLFGLHQKFDQVKLFQDQRNKFQEQRRHRASQISSLRQLRRDFIFGTPNVPENSAHPTENASSTTRYSKIRVFIAVIIFSAITIAGIFLILCKSGTCQTTQ